MAQDIIIRTWCDPCLADDEHNEGKPYPLANGYVVDVCDVHRKPLDEIAAHARRDTSATGAGTGYTCPDCGKVYQSERGVRKHRSQQHAGSMGEDDEPAALFGGAPIPPPCSECGRTFGSNQGLAMHRYRAHGLRSESSEAVRRREQREGSASESA